jgi:predicted Zn-dependent peptidase
VLPVNTSTAIALLADAVLKPAFTDSAVREQLERSIGMARSRKDWPADVVWQYFRSFFFLPPHPYGRPWQGDEITLPHIVPADVMAQYERIYVAKNLIVAAVGPFAVPEIRNLLVSALGRLRAGTRYAWLRASADHSFQGGRVLLVDKPDATQTQLIIGVPGIPRVHPDRISLLLVNNILGGRFTSLLNERLRVESGLSYGAYSYVQEDRLRGAITLHTSMATTMDTPRAIDLVLAVLHRFTKEGVSAEQVATARAYIKATYPPEHLQTAGQLADLLGELELYGLGRDEVDGLFARLDSVTVGQSNRVLKKYFAASDPVMVLIGQSEQLRWQISHYAQTAWEASISEPGFPRAIQTERLSRSKR